MLGVLAVLLIGGCVGCAVIIGKSTNEGLKTVSNLLRSEKVSNEQARALPLGTTRGEVITRFGLSNAGPRPACLYYDVAGSAESDQWRFCFDRVGNGGKLVSKKRV